MADPPSGNATTITSNQNLKAFGLASLTRSTGTATRSGSYIYTGTSLSITSTSSSPCPPTPAPHNERLGSVRGQAVQHRRALPQLGHSFWVGCQPKRCAPCLQVEEDGEGCGGTRRPPRPAPLRTARQQPREVEARAGVLALAGSFQEGDGAGGVGPPRRHEGRGGGSAEEGGA